MMLQDTHISNKNTIDFKQRIKLIQKKEKDQQQLTERRRDENELQVIKIKQKMDKAQNKFRYYEDLNQQTVLKRLKDNNNKQLSKNEMSLNKEIIDYSKSAGVNALIPGINNWNTVGSVPLKRGIEYTKQIQPLLISSSITQAKLDPPKITSARNSKYEKLKELENEYFNLGNGSAAVNVVNGPIANSQNTNPYIEKEKQQVTKSMKAMQEISRDYSWDRRRNSGVLSAAGANFLI